MLTANPYWDKKSYTEVHIFIYSLDFTKFFSSNYLSNTG